MIVEELEVMLVNAAAYSVQRKENVKSAYQVNEFEVKENGAFRLIRGGNEFQITDFEQADDMVKNFITAYSKADESFDLNLKHALLNNEDLQKISFEVMQSSEDPEVGDIYYFKDNDSGNWVLIPAQEENESQVLSPEGEIVDIT